METVQSPLLEYTIMWSTLTLSPILEYLLLFKEYQQTESDWRIISVPERKLPRGFLVSRNYTLRGLTSNQTYHVKIAAVNTYGQGEYSTVTTLQVYRTPPIPVSSPIIPLQYQIYYSSPSTPVTHTMVTIILSVVNNRQWWEAVLWSVSPSTRLCILEELPE